MNGAGHRSGCQRVDHAFCQGDRLGDGAIPTPKGLGEHSLHLDGDGAAGPLSSRCGCSQGIDRLLQPPAVEEDTAPDEARLRLPLRAAVAARPLPPRFAPPEEPAGLKRSEAAA